MRKIEMEAFKGISRNSDILEVLWHNEAVDQSNLLDDSCLEASPSKESSKIREGNVFFRPYDSLGPNEAPHNGFESFQCRKDLRDSEQKAKSNPFHCNPQLLHPKLIGGEGNKPIFIDEMEVEYEYEEDREALKPLNIANNIMTRKQVSSKFEEQTCEPLKVEESKISNFVQNSNSKLDENLSSLPILFTLSKPKDISSSKPIPSSTSRQRESSVSRPKEDEEQPKTSSRSLIPSISTDNESLLKRTFLLKQPNSNEAECSMKDEQPFSNPPIALQRKDSSEPSFTDLLIFFVGIKKEFGVKSSDPQSVLAEVKRHNLAVTKKLKETLFSLNNSEHSKNSRKKTEKMQKKKMKKIESSSSDESSLSDSSSNSEDLKKVRVSHRKEAKDSSQMLRLKDPSRIIRTIDSVANSFQLKVSTLSQQVSDFEQHTKETIDLLSNLFKPPSQPLSHFSEQAFILQTSNYFYLFLEKGHLHPEDLASAFIRTEQFAARRFEDYFAVAPFIAPEVTQGVADFCTRLSFTVTLYCSPNMDRSKIVITKDQDIELIMANVCQASTYFSRIHNFMSLSVYTRLNRLFSVICKQGFFGVEMMPKNLRRKHKNKE